MAFHQAGKLYAGDSEGVVNDKLEKIVLVGSRVDELPLIPVPSGVVIARKEGNIVPPHRLMPSTELQTSVSLHKKRLKEVLAVSTLANSHR
jgi:hypothetical protein